MDMFRKSTTQNVSDDTGEEEAAGPDKRHRLPPAVHEFFFYIACFTAAPFMAYLLSALLRMLGIWWRRPSYFIVWDVFGFTEDLIQNLILMLILAFILSSMRWIKTKEERHGIPLFGIFGGIIAAPFGLFIGISVLLLIEDFTADWVELSILFGSGVFSAALAYTLIMRIRVATPPRYKRELITWGISLAALVSTIVLNPRSSFPRHAESKERHAWAVEHMGPLFPRLEQRILATKAVNQFAGEDARLELTPDRHGMVYSPDAGNWEQLDGSVKVIGTRGSMTCDFTLYGDPVDEERSNFDSVACRTNALYIDLDEDSEVVEEAPFVVGGSRSYTNMERRRFVQNLDPELEHIRDRLAALPWLRDKAGAFERSDIVLVRGDAFSPEQIHPFREMLAIVVQVRGAKNELYCRVGMPWGDISGERDIVECWLEEMGRHTYVSSSNLLISHANQINPTVRGWFMLKEDPPGGEVQHAIAHHEDILKAHFQDESGAHRRPNFSRHFANTDQPGSGWRERFPDRLYLSGPDGEVDFSLIHTLTTVENEAALCEITAWENTENEHAKAIAAQHPERRCWTKTRRFSFDTHVRGVDGKSDALDPDIRNALALPQ